MEKMQGEYLNLVQKCISFARQFMALPPTIEIYFEDCPSERFKTMDNAAEGSGNHVVLNKPWFTQTNRWNNHREDIEFFVFHELRHLHQHLEMQLLDSGKPLHEKKDAVMLWKKKFSNYQRNEGGDSLLANLMQEVEIDVNAYALCLNNFLHIYDSEELRFSIPEKAMDKANERSRIYYSRLPEFVEFIDKEQRKQSVKLSTKKAKPGRNEQCPCGSGRKFKKYCIGKGIYD